MKHDGKPWVGPRAPEWQAGLCSYAHTEADPACLAEARWHGIVLGEDLKGLTCCDEHKPIMNTLADYVHRLDSTCDLPDSLFIEPENRCVLPWDEGELARLEAATHSEIAS